MISFISILSLQVQYISYHLTLFFFVVLVVSWLSTSLTCCVAFNTCLGGQECELSVVLKQSLEQ